MRAGLCYAALLAVILAVPAGATDIKVENFAGKITLVEGNDGLDVVSRGTEGSLELNTSGDMIRIDGGLNSKERNQACKGAGISWNLTMNGRKSEGNTRLEDYPDLRISVPAGSNLEIDDSSVELTSDVDLGETSLDLAGCFDVVLADTGDLKLDRSGSGSFDAGRVGRLDVEKSGSGDMTFAAAESLDLEASGSGEFEIGAVSGHVRIEKSGSGDTEIGSVNGNVRVEKSGSGDVEINGGFAEMLTIENSGSGDVDIDAAVGTASINASGSGDIYVKSISGSVQKSISGSADFKRGDD